MKRIFGILAAAALTASCGSAAQKEEKEKESYVKAKETLEEKERKNPAMFITASCRDRGNIIGQTVLKITLTSTAKIAAYQNVQVELSFYSETGSLLQKDVTTIYKRLEPGESITVKDKEYRHKQTDSIGLKILSAENAPPK